jgi:hypothetical protein
MLLFKTILLALLAFIRLDLTRIFLAVFVPLSFNTVSSIEK